MTAAHFDMLQLGRGGLGLALLHDRLLMNSCSCGTLPGNHNWGMLLDLFAPTILELNNNMSTAAAQSDGLVSS